ncbi:Stealth CR1 domain-containing protein [Lentilactobacillus buchneri]|uniref:Stealth CR1 domain-containing protein n=1 Tax=Lentilactobacillus buchneri TaxID=1581 RepID=UPI0021A72CF1|nr:Stealth CR1 domain-containing protein [Lentilactobacillus buchneri]MCT3551750.1 capsule biosynthesis protein CapG [Lentilactobacillus buchneri]
MNIDFVVTWVNENDSKWLGRKKKYNKDYSLRLNDESRFRDWDNFKFWFRSVERYAPWVHKVFLITEGHLPEWLNINNNKLICIKHADYINNEYLPTFNSNVIELNVNNIKNLGEHFVLFNDDTFLNKPVKPTDFFSIDGVPKDTGIFSPIVPRKNSIDHIVLNNIEIINSHFNSRDVLRKNFRKYFNLKYSKYNIKNIIILPWKRILGFFDTHIPVSYNKSSFNHVWKLENKALADTCRNKFRTDQDVSHWLIRYWQLCTKNGFVPRKVSFGKCYNVIDDTSQVTRDILDLRHSVICINDNEKITNFPKVKSEINAAFENKFNRKSTYEI